MIAIVLAFFVTPLGDYGKIVLNRWFATSPTVIEPSKRNVVSDYDWKLKNENWDYFDFKKSEGKVVFISFWTTWHLPSRAQLSDVQELYDRYKGQMEFYIITDEEREPVNEFLSKNDYTFPITYQIIGEPSPIKLLKPPGSYVLDRKGRVVIHQTAISDWDNDKVFNLLDNLISD